MENKGKKILKKNLYPSIILTILKKYFLFFHLTKFEPIQFGFFFRENESNILKKILTIMITFFFIISDLVNIFQKLFFGNTILEMGDLYSENYFQTLNI